MILTAEQTTKAIQEAIACYESFVKTADLDAVPDPWLGAIFGCERRCRYKWIVQGATGSERHKFHKALRMAKNDEVHKRHSVTHNAKPEAERMAIVSKGFGRRRTEKEMLEAWS